MEYYKRIADSLEELSNGQIQRKKRKTFFPIACIILGLVLMWWGIAKWTAIGYAQTSYILVFGGLFIVGWGIVMLAFNTHYHVVRETGEVITPQKVFLNPASQDITVDLMKQGKLNDVLQYSINQKSPLLLELWQTNGHKLLYSQLIYKQKAKENPISEALVIDKNHK